jgi:hypothetical protein
MRGPCVDSTVERTTRLSLRHKVRRPNAAAAGGLLVVVTCLPSRNEQEAPKFCIVNRAEPVPTFRM